jgi:hypothetical protein
VNLNDFRNACLGEVPVDTRNMLLNGFRFYETDILFRCQADLGAVPYIYYNEEGTVFTQKNKGFISQKMVSAVNNLMVADMNGQTYSQYRPNEEALRDKVLQVESGVIEKLR